MSHDRGCPCGRERWDYATCGDARCLRRDLVQSVALAEAVRRDTLMRVARNQAERAVRRLSTDDVLRRVRRRS